jgi:hypothetical protein
MAKFIGTPIRGTDFASVSDEAISAKVASDTHARIRIDAGGRLTWGSGSSSGDINLYRDSASVLATDDILRAVSGLVTLTTNGTPTEELPNGAIAIDTTNHIFYYRSNNAWNQVTTGGGGNASLTVSDTPPAGPESGDLWFESDTGKTFVYYDSFWVEVGESGGYVLAESISGNAATATKLATARTISLTGDISGSVLFDGSANASISATIQPNSITLGTDTTGDYISSLVAGTGLNISNNSGESATPTISIGQDVGTSASVTFAAISATASVASSSTTSANLGYIGLPQNSKAANYELVIGDQGKHIYVTSTSTITIPANSSVGFPIGSVVTIIAAAGATVTIAITSDTMLLAGAGTTGSRTLAAYGIATLVKVAETTWFINGTGVS